MISEEQLLSLLPITFRDSDLPLVGKVSGKVRDSYNHPRGRLLVTTDRLSAFDRVLATVPYKGQVLNQLAAWWFTQTHILIDNHIISVPDPNAILAIPTKPFPIEVIVRGYISGVTSTSLWYRYSLGERYIYGYHFPENLHKNQVLPNPIITPTTKGGATGHDERLTCGEVTKLGLLDEETWELVQAAALRIFREGQTIAQQSGLILVDTKYEFGRAEDGRILLIDEVHTPDSSRYWKADTYEVMFAAGKEPDNFDKEFVRLAYAEYNYRGNGTPPIMPERLWVAASQRYIAIYEILTGLSFMPGAYPVATRLKANLQKAGLL